MSINITPMVKPNTVSNIVWDTDLEIPYNRQIVASNGAKIVCNSDTLTIPLDISDDPDEFLKSTSFSFPPINTLSSIAYKDASNKTWVSFDSGEINCELESYLINRSADLTFGITSIVLNGNYVIGTAVYDDIAKLTITIDDTIVYNEYISDETGGNSPVPYTIDIPEEITNTLVNNSIRIELSPQRLSTGAGTTYTLAFNGISTKYYANSYVTFNGTTPLLNP